MDLNREIKLAKEGFKNAHAPHSKYHVGAALKTKSGKIFSRMQC